MFGKRKRCVATIFNGATYRVTYTETIAIEPHTYKEINEELNKEIHEESDEESGEDRLDDGILLMAAVRIGDSKLLKHILANTDPDGTWLVDHTPLTLAVSLNQLEATKLLIEAGANVNAENSHQYSPIILAIRYNREHIVKMLIDSEANIDRGSRIKPILEAINQPNTKILQLLIEHKAYLGNMLYKAYVTTPLLYAIDNNKFGAIKTILACSNNSKMTDKQITYEINNNTNISGNVKKYLLDKKQRIKDRNEYIKDKNSKRRTLLVKIIDKTPLPKAIKNHIMTFFDDPLVHYE